MTGASVWSRAFAVLGSDESWVVAFTAEQMARWRIRKAPAGALPPWRQAQVPAEVVCDEQGLARYTGTPWWVFAPGSLTPCATASTNRAALRAAEQERHARTERRCGE